MSQGVLWTAKSAGLLGIVSFDSGTCGLGKALAEELAVPSSPLLLVLWSSLNGSKNLWNPIMRIISIVIKRQAVHDGSRWASKGSTPLWVKSGY